MVLKKIWIFGILPVGKFHFVYVSGNPSINKKKDRVRKGMGNSSHILNPMLIWYMFEIKDLAFPACVLNATILEKR